MELISLNIFLHIIFGAMTRMLQGSMPFHLNMSKFRSYSKPWILPSFQIIRFLFLSLIIYNSAVLSLLFSREVLIPYFIWYTFTIAWINPFIKGNFYLAFKIMAICTLYVTVLAIEFPPFIPNVIWCIYLLYITSWYNWCLPI